MKQTAPRDEDYFPVSALTIMPNTSGQFDLYLKRKGGYLLYAHKGDIFNNERLAQVLELTEFYVHREHRFEYENYLARNLGDLLQNESVPIKERAKVFYNISSSVVKKVFETKMPRNMLPEAHKKLLALVNSSILFLTQQDALKNISQFISHTYHTFSHSVNVMVLTLAVLQTYPEVDKKALREVGLGCLLHDLGKVEVPSSILNKSPETLTRDEWDVLRTHPVKGLQMCENIPLARRSLNCILLHHERMDGKGYPGGLAGDDIPFEVRAISAVNIYDALTSERHYAKAMAPFEALQFMKTMSGVVFPDIYKRLVFVLGRAQIAKGVE